MSNHKSSRNLPTNLKRKTVPRIIRQGEKLSWDEEDLIKPAPCLKCGTDDALFDNRILINHRADNSEEFYCFNCWQVLADHYDWFGVLCVVVFLKDRHRSEIGGHIINRIFGNPFDYYHAIDAGVLLSSNHFTHEQLTLF